MCVHNRDKEARGRQLPEIIKEIPLHLITVNLDASSIPAQPCGIIWAFPPPPHPPTAASRDGTIAILQLCSSRDPCAGRIADEISGVPKGPRFGTRRWLTSIQDESHPAY